VVPEQKLSPDTAQIEAHLRHLTRRWHELGQPVVMEIVHLTADDKAIVKDVSRFSPDDMGISLAVDHIAAMNAHGVNSYVTVNPIDATRPLRAGHRADTADIAGSFYHFADGDTQQAADNIRNFVGPKCTFVVVTGTVPHVRPHVYWELEEPTRNLPAWSRIQASIAATLATDKVIDAPRIMRVAGSINYPKPEKRNKRGYITELTSIHIHDPDERPPVTSEQMDRAFQGRPASPASGIQIDTGNDYGPALDRALAIASIKADSNWRNNVKALVASYVARGWTDDEILDRCDAFTLPGYTADDTRKDVAAFIQWTREQEARNGGKFATSPTGQGAEAHQFREMSEAEREAVPGLDFKPWGIRNLAAIPHPEFIYTDFYARGYTSLTVAPPKVGKSMLGLAEAVDMASGRGTLSGAPRDPLRVLYYNAEDDQSVLDARVAALLCHYGVKQEEVAETLFPVSGVDAEGFYMVTGQDGVINETLFVALEKFIAAQRIDALIFDPLQDLSSSPETNEVFRALGQRLRRFANTTRVAIGLIHHTRKMQPGATATMDDSRGGGALRGTSRFNRLLLPMTEDEGIKAGVENHRHFMRIGEVEANLAPPSADVNRWFQKISVPIPNGHDIGAVEPWVWPDAFSNVTREDACRVQAALREMEDEPPRLNTQSAQWVGYVVARVLGVDADDKATRNRIGTMVKTWIKTGVLDVVEIRDARAGRDVKAVLAGQNSPMTQVDA